MCHGGNLETIREIEINCCTYKVTLQQVGECEYELYVAPCTLPSAVFNVARIRCVENSCMEFDFYEARIYTDPIITIIDCSFKQIIRRCIEEYFANADLECAGNTRGNNGLFFW